MTPERWKRIEDLLRQASEQPPGEREAFLAAACAGDPDLKSEVENLLAPDTASERTGINTVTLMHRVGDQLGPYRIEARVGGGGMGEVFRAFDNRLHRRVAIKVCSQGFGDRFEREARAISAFNHPNICTLYDVGPNYLVMELLDGSTLADEIKKGPLAPGQVARYGAQIAAALAEAHARGVVHRDLKPRNIMVTRHGVKVLDFGLAKMVSEAGLTEANVVMGTPAYMAPEQVEGKEADARTDLFALGLVLSEMAAGRLPLPRESLGRMMASGSVATAPRLSETGMEVPAGLDALVADLVEKDPAQRRQSAAEVAAELSALADRLAAPAVSPARSLLRPAVLVPAAAALLVAILGGGWLYQRSERRRWAREEAIPEINRLNGETKPLAAFQTLLKAEQILPGDSRLAQAAQNFTQFTSVKAPEAGARIEIQDYLDPNGLWYSLGATPLEHVRIPKGYFRWKISKPGAGEFVAAPATADAMVFPLEPPKDADAGMVQIPGGPWGDLIGFIGWMGFPLPAFAMDR
ncbi:MAG TPA: serine/threonine-protein kinase, partial [Candidatus Sulfopaludibacter sp.]|nr:serine/threonine-protein kinase [Candidatus Sulfopaludibacter sp.]